MTLPSSRLLPGSKVEDDSGLKSHNSSIARTQHSRRAPYHGLGPLDSPREWTESLPTGALQLGVSGNHWVGLGKKKTASRTHALVWLVQPNKSDASKSIRRPGTSCPMADGIAERQERDDNAKQGSAGQGKARERHDDPW